MLGSIFGQDVAKQLRDMANFNCNGDIETLIKTATLREYLPKSIPTDKVLLYFSLENVEAMEKDVLLDIKEAAKTRADYLYKQYLEGMTAS